MVRKHLKHVKDWRTNFKFRPATWVITENKLQSDLTDFYVLPFHMSFAQFEHFFIFMNHRTFVVLTHI